MTTKNTPTEGQNSAKLEAESALRDAACSPSYPLPTFPVFDEMHPLAPPIPIILLLETAILRIAFEQDKRKAESLKTPYIENAHGRWLQIDADRLFQKEGMTEILEFSAKFWGNSILENRLRDATC
jgi:hypothetical protein